MDDATNPLTIVATRPRARCACGRPAAYCNGETDWLDLCGDCLRARRRARETRVPA